MLTSVLIHYSFEFKGTLAIFASESPVGPQTCSLHPTSSNDRLRAAIRVGRAEVTMDNSTEPKVISGLRELASYYDTFLIDQWGVLHGGSGMYEGAVEALRELKRQGLRSLIVTNSSKTTLANVERLERFGLPRDIYSGLISSAQILRDRIVQREGSPWDQLGRRGFVIAAEGDAS